MGARGPASGLLALLLGAVALGGGCPSDPRAKEPPIVVAVVGGTEITRPQLVAELSRAGVARLLDEESRQRLGKEVLERMVRQELLYQAALAADVKVDSHEVERELARAAAGYPPGMFQRVLHAEQLTFQQYEQRVMRRTVVDKYLRERFSRLPAATEEEVQARWRQRAAELDLPEQVRARQILVKTEEEAEDLLAQIKKGAISFEDAARKHSEAPEKHQGGDLGWFARGQMPPVFEGCFSLTPRKPSDVVASEFGFHIFLVEEKKAGGAQPLEEARRRIEVELLQERQEQALAAHAEELRGSVKVTISDAAFAAALAQLPDGPFDEERGPDEVGHDPAVPEGEQPGAALKTAPRAKPVPEAPGAVR